MFQGFSQQTNDFLWGIRFNNERSWFEAHKQEYLDYVQSPLRQLAQEVYARFSAAHEELPLMVRVSRIYRDARRLYGRGPYKSHLWFSLRMSGLKFIQPAMPMVLVSMRPGRLSWQSFVRQWTNIPRICCRWQTPFRGKPGSGWEQRNTSAPKAPHSPLWTSGTIAKAWILPVTGRLMTFSTAGRWWMNCCRLMRR